MSTILATKVCRAKAEEGREKSGRRAMRKGPDSRRERRPDLPKTSAIVATGAGRLVGKTIGPPVPQGEGKGTGRARIDPPSAGPSNLPRRLRPPTSPFDSCRERRCSTTLSNKSDPVRLRIRFFILPDCFWKNRNATKCV